jgi:nucleoside-diphosphate-sugar epimerase
MKLEQIGFWRLRRDTKTMRVFLLGATGALGMQLVPQLINQRHTVTGTTRSPTKAIELTQQGCQAAVVNALDREALIATVQKAEPEILIHQLTAIPPRLDMRHFDREFQATNRLRTEGTDNVLAAARRAGVRQVIAQSFAGWPYAHQGGRIKTEQDPFDSAPPAEFRRTLKAIQA